MELFLKTVSTMKRIKAVVNRNHKGEESWNM